MLYLIPVFLVTDKFDVHDRICYHVVTADLAAEAEGYVIQTVIIQVDIYHSGRYRV